MEKNFFQTFDKIMFWIGTVGILGILGLVISWLVSTLVDNYFVYFGDIFTSSILLVLLAATYFVATRMIWFMKKQFHKV